ncbi:hypothetical protein D3C74_319060 [compost metagenome]
MMTTDNELVLILRCLEQREAYKHVTRKIEALLAVSYFKLLDSLSLQTYLKTGNILIM